MKLRGIAISLLTEMNKDGQDDRHVKGIGWTSLLF